MSLVWGGGFTLFGVLLALVVSIIDPSSMDTGETIPGIAALMGTVGAAGGALFGVLFSVSHRRSTFKELSLSRVATWGLVGGALIPIVFGKDPRMGLIFGPVGALIGTGVLALARRAPERDQLAPSADQGFTGMTTPGAVDAVPGITDPATVSPAPPPATTSPPGRHALRGSCR